jgi:hypothetical protein
MKVLGISWELFLFLPCLIDKRREEMAKIILSKKFWVVSLLCLGLAFIYSEAFAAERGRGRREVVVVGHRRYHYDDGRFYKPSWFGFQIAIRVPPIGATVTYIPAGHRTIIFGGVTYYYYDNVYYKPCPSGYIVVPAPVVVAPQNLAGETVTINVPNSNGSYTPVILVKRGNGYVGPQGEYYPGNPTVEQLRALYGK